MRNNKLINNHCCKKRFRKLRSRCKLNDSICSNAKTQKKDSKLIQDFYSALRIEDRVSALSAIVSNDGFLKEFYPRVAYIGYQQAFENAFGLTLDEFYNEFALWFDQTPKSEKLKIIDVISKY